MPGAAQVSAPLVSDVSGSWCLLWFQVVSVAVGRFIECVGHCAEGAASHPLCLSCMRERVGRMSD